MRWRRRRFAKRRQAMRQALVVRRREFYAWFDAGVVRAREAMAEMQAAGMRALDRAIGDVFDRLGKP